MFCKREVGLEKHTKACFSLLNQSDPIDVNEDNGRYFLNLTFRCKEFEN